MEKFWVLQRSRRIRANALHKEYLTAEQLLGNLPVVLRTLCDHVLTGHASVAYRLASSPHPLNFIVLQRSRRIRANALHKEYLTAEQLLGNLPVVLRTLCDHVLTGHASVAYRLASSPHPLNFILLAST